MKKQKVDTGLNIPFSFVTFSSSLRRFYHWSKYSVCGYMCVHSHKFRVYDAEFLHLKLLQQNAPMDVKELHSKPDRTQHFTLSFYPSSRASSLKSTFLFHSMYIQSFIHTALLSQEMNLKTAHVRLQGSLTRYKLLSAGLRDGKRGWRGEEQSDTGY